MMIINIYPNAMPEAIGAMRGTLFPTGKCLEPPLPVLTRCGAFEREADFGEATPEDRNVLSSPFLRMTDSWYIVGEGNGLGLPALCPHKQR